MYIYMLVKDLYYQKYLKYKTKYLNLLSQTGGAAMFITETEGNTITINNKENGGSRAFSVEELNKPGITTIKLENVMEYSDIVHILTAQDFSNINTLIFDGNDLSTIDNVNLIVSIIKLFKNVLNLKFNKNNINDKGAEALAELLKVNSTIEILNLNENNIGNKGINALAEALKKNTTVKQLYLNKNNIDDKGAEALAELLKVNSTIEILNLNENNIGNEGINALAEALKQNTTVKQLYLKKNIFNTEGTAALGKALYENEKIENLYITMGSNKNDSESDLRTHFKTKKKELHPLVI